MAKKKAEQPRQIDELETWLWDLGEDDRGNLVLADLKAAASAAGIVLPQLTFLTVITDGESAFEILKRRAADIRGTRDLRHGGGILWTRLRQRDYLVTVWPSGEQGVFHLMGTAPVTDSRWDRVEGTWMRQAAPRISKVTLNADDFAAIGDALSQEGTVEVSRLSARIPEDHSSYTRGWPETARQRPSHEDALTETKGMVLRTLTLNVGGLSVHLRRSAGATFYRGGYTVFLRQVLGRLAAAAAERRGLLSNRARHRAERVTETITLNLPEGASVWDAAGRHELLAALAHVPGVQTAVFHENPYFHFAVTDYLDGSNFDVFVSECDRVELVPGFVATVGSLARVTEAIGEAVGMVAVTAHKVPARISDEDLLN